MHDLRVKIVEAYGLTVRDNDVIRVHTEGCSGHDSPGYEVEFICKTFEFEPVDKIIDAVVERLKKFPTSPDGLITTHAYTATDSMIRWLRHE